jgi:hypothetical protein
MATALAGCAQPSGSAGETEARQHARESVEQALNGVAHDRYDDIYFAARAVDAALETTGVRLIGIAETQAADLVDPFGTVSLMVAESTFTDDAGESHTAGPFCFRVRFSYYGAEVDGDEVAAEQSECPADAAEVTPPPDETVYPVIPENARDAVHQVLQQIVADGEIPAADEIAARIVQLLTPPESELQSLAKPDVLVDAGRIGVALQDSSECLLVKLTDDTVTDVYPPAVLLQPGELGCSAGTAIADDDQLRSPH